MTENVTRLEIIDNTPCKVCKGKRFVMLTGQEEPRECPNCDGLGFPGRSVLFWDINKQIQMSLQDDGQTLKIFINERG